MFVFFIFLLTSICVRQLDVGTFAMLLGRDSTSMLGEYYAASGLIVVGGRAT